MWAQGAQEMKDRLFRDLLDWFMVSDPWPLGRWAHDRIEDLLNAESHGRGFTDWVVAYHEFKEGPIWVR